MRIRKDPQIRKNELIDAAMELFSTAGYEKTMIVDIVKKAGVAKGTFFYYFPTKEAILEAICLRWAMELVDSYKLKSYQHTPVNKLTIFIVQLLLPNQVDIVIDRLWHEKQFNLVYRTWQQQVENVFNPILKDIIEQGNQDGTMHVDSINETMDFFWSTIDCLLDVVALEESTEEAFLARTKIAESVLEIILGINAGTLKLSNA